MQELFLVLELVLTLLLPARGLFFCFPVAELFELVPVSSALLQLLQWQRS